MAGETLRYRFLIDFRVTSTSIPFVASVDIRSLGLLKNMMNGRKFETLLKRQARYDLSKDKSVPLKGNKFVN